MLRLGNLLKRTLAPAALCVLALSACGSQKKPQSSSSSTASTTTTTPAPNSRSVWIYSSLPERGPLRPEAQQIREGISLVLPAAPKTFDGFQIHYKPLNDSAKQRRGRAATPGTSDRSHSRSTVTGLSLSNTNGSNPAATVKDAERAARNPQTIAYIGDLDSAATELSLPILNQAGILQITPGSGYPGLTDYYKGITLQGEPGKYYPQSPHTLLRLIPNDVIQASAALDVLHGDMHCSHVAAWAFGRSQETAALLNAVMLTAPKYGMRYYKPPPLAPGPKQPADAPSSYYGYIHTTLAPDALQCAVLVGRVTPAAVAFTAELRVLAPIVPVIGTSGFCNRAWTRIPSSISKAAAKGVTAGLYCTTPAVPVTKYAGHARFVAAFQSAYHHQPSAYACYGYEAAEMVLNALRELNALGELGHGQDTRQQLVNGLVVDGVASDATGAFTFDPQGNVMTNGLGAIAGYGIDDLAKGAPRFNRLVNPVAHLYPSGG